MMRIDIKIKILVMLAVGVFFVPNISNASVFGVSPSSLRNGLVGHWTFDGKDTINGTIRDVSGNGNNGSALNIATTTFYKPGKIGQALAFDGVDDYTITNDISAAEGSVITVSAWVNGQTGVASRKIVSKASASTVSWDIYTSSGSGGHYGFQVCNATPTCATARTNLGVNADGNWHFVTGTYDGTTVLLYYDGVVQSTTGSLTGDIRNTTNNVCFGSVAAGTNCTLSTFWKGLMDDVRIYNRALSATEIKQLYNMGASTKQAVSQPIKQTNCSGLSCGLVGYWTFDGKDTINGTIRDVSGNGNNGSAIGIATSTFYSPGKIGQGGNFDGVDDRVQMPDVQGADNVNALTVNAWVKFTPGISGVNIITSKYLPGQGPWYFYYSVGTRAFGCRIIMSDNSNATAASASYPASSHPGNDARWHNASCVYDGSAITIYADGVAGTPAAITGTIKDRTDPVCIAAQTSGSNCTTSDLGKGIIDDVRIYNRALSATEIQQLYNMGSATKQAVSQPIKRTSCTGLSCGLVGYWTFDGKDMPQGRVNDVSGNGNTGNMINMSSSTAYIAGKIGQALRFDGVDDHIATTNSISGTENTRAVWIYWKGVPSGGTESHVVEYSPTQFFITTANSLRFKATAASTYTSTQPTIPLNTWTHVVGVCNSVGHFIYVNGVLASESNNTTTCSTGSGVVNVGRYYGSSNYFFNGFIDDVRIYNRALSATEIKQLYNLGR